MVLRPVPGSGFEAAARFGNGAETGADRGRNPDSDGAVIFDKRGIKDVDGVPVFSLFKISRID